VSPTAGADPGRFPHCTLPALKSSPESNILFATPAGAAIVALLAERPRVCSAEGAPRRCIVWFRASIRPSLIKPGDAPLRQTDARVRPSEPSFDLGQALGQSRPTPDGSDALLHGVDRLNERPDGHEGDRHPTHPSTPRLSCRTPTHDVQSARGWGSSRRRGRSRLSSGRVLKSLASSARRVRETRQADNPGRKGRTLRATKTSECPINRSIQHVESIDARWGHQWRHNR
jgi:hypothetical protein